MTLSNSLTQLKVFLFKIISWLGFKQQHLGCVHTSFYTPWEKVNSFENILEYFKIVSENRRIVLKTHDFSYDT